MKTSYRNQPIKKLSPTETMYTMTQNRHNTIRTKLLAKPVWTCLLIACCTTIAIVGPSAALQCYCNHCSDSDYCTASNYSTSRCYISVRRTVNEGVRQDVKSFGCLSGSELNDIYTLQCETDYRKMKELSYIKCCDQDYCNENLSEPTEKDDPRWGEQLHQPPPITDDSISQKLEIWQIVALTIIVSIVCLLICYTVYKISSIMYATYWADFKNKPGSPNLEHTFTINFNDQLKSPFLLQHQSTISSSASTHTSTTSEYLPSKSASPHDCEHSLDSIEHTTTLPDVTSGIGTKVLVPRTMARVVDCGVTVPVGSGRFGRVFRGQYHGDDVAVKAFQAMDHESWHREENILRKLNHDNIVRLIASESYTIGNSSSVETWMFLEFCPYGSLCDYLDNHEVCGPQQAVNLVLSIIKGLSYLHEDYTTGYKPPIAHRDIKSKNILMKTPEVCKLADFGHAVVQINEEKLDFGGYDRFQVGTIRYMAPEILSPDSSFDPTQFHTFAQADLYQFGLVLWEICFRTTLDVLHPSGPHSLPYDNQVPQNPGIEDMIKLVCHDRYRPPRPPHWEKHRVMSVLSSLMIECWRSNPKARMETLGVKKRVQELYDQLYPQSVFYDTQLLDINSIMNNHRDMNRSIEYTL